MRRSSVRRLVLLAGGAAAVGAVAALPGAATAAPAATAKVQVGNFSQRDGAGMNAFYPRQMVVHQGDRVTFTFAGFHTVVFPKKGGAPPPLVVPGAPNPATNDPAGAPYWWSGTTPALGFNPKAVIPTKDTRVTGARTVSSGVPQGNKGFTVSFPKVGTFQIRCAVHPNMKGSIKVLPRRATGPSAAVLAARTAKQKAADIKAGAAFAKKGPAKAAKLGGVLIGNGNAAVQVFAFFPKVTTVKAGSAVTFTMGGRNEIHTATFGPPAFLTRLSKTFQGSPVFDSQATYPTDRPGTPAAVTPTAHGNGFVNSGILADPGVPGAPRSFTFTFPTPGTYQYMCLIHPEMKGTVNVTP